MVGARHLGIEHSKAQLSVQKVTGRGKPMATAVYGAVGFNVNCNSWVAAAGLSFPLPTGLTVSPTSVTTSPTLNDYVGAIASWLAEGIFSFIVDALVRSGANAVFRDILSALGIRIVRTVTKLAIKYAPKLLPFLEIFLNPVALPAHPWVQQHS